MIIIILDLKDEALTKRANYTFSQIMSYLGYEYEIINNATKNFVNNKKYSLLIYYGGNLSYIKNKINTIQIISKSSKKFNTIQKKLYSFKNKRTVIFNRDIILEAFNILARQEEIDSENVDKHRRFIAKKSKIFKHLKEPIVNEYAIILDKLIKKLHYNDKIPLVQKCSWPENKKFAVCLTHDVDVVKFVLSDFAKAGKIVDFIKGENPYWQFDKIVELEKNFNFKSTFFFCPGKKHRLDPNYSIKDRKILDLIKQLIKDGKEIGVHLSYLSYNDKSMMLHEKNEVYGLAGKKIGARTHFLRFDVPKTWILEDEIGLYYDSSLGYPGHTGYRSGFCWPYHPYIAGHEKELDIFELPLSVMDSTLFAESRTEENAMKLLQGLFDNIEKYNGLVVMNWHQRVFNEKYFIGWASVYKKCLEYFKAKEVFASSAENVLNWIANRDLLDISETIDSNILKIKLNPRAKVNGFALKLENVEKSKLKIAGTGDYSIKEQNNCINIIFGKIGKNSTVILEIRKD